ncbi:hypothetical protein [Nocardia sp. NPDC059228]|uniref:hypothetical protein n=1 Tax=Nocardia sp. NPDC059228 TaxID=3346777 RepID=UPI0036786583
MRTLIAVAAVAGALSAGIGPASAAPLPLIDVSGTPAATDTVGSGSSLTGSASQSAQWLERLLCLNPNCSSFDGHIG